jgi:hypothetical protein
LLINVIPPFLKKFEELDAYPNFRQALIHDSSLLKKVDELVKEQTEIEASLMKHQCPPRYMVPVLAARNKLLELRSIATEVRNLAPARVQPPWFHFAGEPGVGKSDLTKLLMHDIWHNMPAVLGPKAPTGPFDSTRYFSRKVENEYWEGYAGQFFFCYDDLLQVLDPQLRAKQALEMIYAVNVAPFHLHYASMDNKENRFFTSKVVLTTSNGLFAPIDLGLTDPGAFLRRRTAVIEVKPVPDRKDCTMSDPEFRNGWLFHLHDSYGVSQNTILTYPQLLALIMSTLAIAVNKSLESDPAPMVVSDDDAVTAKALVASIRASNIQSKEGVTQLTESAEKSAKRRKHKHGAAKRKFAQQGNSAAKAEKIAEIQETIRDCRKLLAQPQIHSDDVLYVVNSIEDMRSTLGLDPPSRGMYIEWLSATQTTPASIAGRNVILKSLGDCTYEALTQSSNSARISWWDWFCTEAQTVCTSIGAFFLGLVFSTAYMILTSRIATWLSENKVLALLLGALTVIAMIGGILGLVYYFQTPKTTSAEMQVWKEYDEGHETVDAAERNFGDVPQNPETTFRGVQSKKTMKSLRREFYDGQIATSDLSVVQMIDKNLFSMSVLSDGTTSQQRGQCLFITGRIAITALHVWDSIKKYCVEFPDNTRGKLTQKFADKTNDFMFSPSQVTAVPIKGTEAVLLRFSVQKSECRDITSHFMDEAFADSMPEMIVEDIKLSHRMPGGSLLTQEAPITHMKLKHLVNAKTKEVLPPLPFWHTDLATPDGSSGGLLWTGNTKVPRKLLGLHTGRSNSLAIASCVTLELIRSALAQLPPDDFAHNDVVTTDVQLQCETFDPFANQQEPVGLVLKGASLPTKNPTRPSIIAKALRAEGIHSTKLPVHLRPFVPLKLATGWIKEGVLDNHNTPEHIGTEMVSPLDMTIEKLGKTPVLIPVKLMQATDAPDDFPMGHGHYVIPSLEMVAFGNAPLNIEPVDIRTSPGYPWSVTPGLNTRKGIFALTDAKSKSPRTAWSPEFNAALDSQIKALSTGAHFAPIFTNSLKVELRPVDRVLQGKARRFFGSPLDDILVSKVLLWSLMKSHKVHHYRDVNVGINPHGIDWHEMISSHMCFPNHMCLDVSGFDVGMMYPIIAHDANRVAQGIAQSKLVIMEPSMKDWTNVQVARAASSKYKGAVHALHLQENKLFRMVNVLGSGKLGTSVIGSRASRRMFRMCSVAAVLREVTEKRLFLGSLTPIQWVLQNSVGSFYGDDQWISVSADMAFFTPLLYTQLMLEIFGYVMTDPKKGAVSVDFAPLSDVIFLQRNISLRDGYHYAPLQKSIIEDSICWSDDPQNARVNSLSCTRSAMFEAVHHGKEYYEQLGEKIARAYKQVGMDWSPPNYAELDHELRNGA